MEITFRLTDTQAAALRVVLAQCFDVEHINSDEDIFITNAMIPSESSLRVDFGYFADDIGGISEFYDLPEVITFLPSHSATNPSALLVLYGNECRLEGHRCALKADGYIDLVRDLGDVAIKSYITSDSSLAWYETNSEWV